MKGNVYGRVLPIERQEATPDDSRCVDCGHPHWDVLQHGYVRCGMCLCENVGRNTIELSDEGQRQGDTGVGMKMWQVMAVVHNTDGDVTLTLQDEHGNTKVENYPPGAVLNLVRRTEGGIDVSMQWIRRNYSVPAKRGGRVRFFGTEGTITSATHYLRVRMDDGRRVLLHPTWHVDYL